MSRMGLCAPDITPIFVKRDRVKLASPVPRVTPVLQYHWQWPIPLGGKIIQKTNRKHTPTLTLNLFSIQLG